MHVWTVDDAAIATLLWERGASGIITNRPREIRQALQALEQLGLGSTPQLEDA